MLLVADDDGLYGRVGHALNLSLHDDHAFVYVSVCLVESLAQKKILFVVGARGSAAVAAALMVATSIAALVQASIIIIYLRLISIPLVTCANLFNTLLLSLLSPRQLPLVVAA